MRPWSAGLVLVVLPVIAAKRRNAPRRAGISLVKANLHLDPG